MTPARFDGWRIVALAAALIWLGPGLLEIYGFLALPLERELGLSGRSFGLGISIFVLAIALTGPLAGALLDRGPLRALMLLGVALTAGALVAISRARDPSTLAAWCAVSAVGIGVYGQFGPQVMVARWFTLRRGRALALASLGTSLAGVTIPLISRALIDAIGWRNAVLAFGCAVGALLAPAALRFVIDGPASVGQWPDGLAPLPESGPSAAAQPAAPDGIGGVLRTPSFWLLGLALAIATSVSLGGMFLVKHMHNVGVGGREASFVLSAMSGGALCGRVASGWLLDRFEKRFVAAALIAMLGVGWLGIAQASSAAAFFALALPAGFAAGGFGVCGPVLQAACFGPNVLGRVMGLHGLLGLPLLLSVAPLIGSAADEAGGFAPVFRALALALFAAAAVISRVRTAPAVRTSG